MDRFNNGVVECGQANPLANIGTHFTKDVSLREFQHPSSSISTIPNARQSEVLPPPSTFRMDSLLRELRNQPSASQQYVPPSTTHQEWTKEYIEKNSRAGLQAQASDSAWTREYNSGRLEPLWHASHSPVTERYHHLMANHTMPMHPITIHDPTIVSARELLDDSKWVTGYNASTHDTDARELQATAKDILNTVTDPNLKATEFMNYVEKLSAGQQDNNVARDDSDEWAAEYTESLFDDRVIQDSSNGAEVNTEDFWENLQQEWNKLAAEEAESHPWLSGTPTSEKQYVFNEGNPFQDASDPLSLGKQRLVEGDIPGAVLAFEAAVQKYPDNPEGWLLLGTTQAQNEQDLLAISALKKCLELDQGNLTALMTLAASQTNESLQLQAAKSLKKWLKANPKYAHFLPENEPEEVSSMPHVSSVLPRDDLSKVQKLFMKVARLNPVTEVDPDVQCGLGILFNLSSEYDKAADCFQAALNVQPNDSLLWNRLGATLANGGKSAEATAAYRRALEISPGFIRTRYNLGISCVNLGAYREAAEHFLSTLNHQQQAASSSKVNSNVMSDSIWSSMRMVLHLINKSELTPAIDARDLPRLNKEFNMVN